MTEIIIDDDDVHTDNDSRFCLTAFPPPAYRLRRWGECSERHQAAAADIIKC
jgi:hypothetical protein